MAKIRFTDCGLELPENLYADPRGRPNVWRYKGPDGRFKQLIQPAEKAIKIAAEANRIRAESGRQPGSFHFYREKYIAHREHGDPSLIDKPSWANRKRLLSNFCEEFKDVKPADARYKTFKHWWEGLTYDQQHNRRSEFSRFFQWMIAEDAVYLNPFTTADDKPRLFEKGKPKKVRLPMTPEAFWKIYAAAGELGLESVQLFMGYALITDLRESDILKLRLDEHVLSDRLRVVIGKSVEQRGQAQASHHCWTFSKHPLVHSLVKRSRELSIRHQRCPFLVSHKHQARRKSETKEHPYQLLPRHLITLFGAARDHSGVYRGIPEGRAPATIHEIRGLSLHIAQEAGHDIEELQHLAAHTNVRVTKTYMAEHKPTYKEVGVVFTDKMIGGVL